MSSVAIFIVSSSAAALQTRCFLSTDVGAKECWRWNTEGSRIHQHAACCNKQTVIRLQSSGVTRRNRSTTSAKAGLGRYSGAIHGNSKGKSRSRRRAPVEQDNLQECDEHEDSESGSDASLTTESLVEESDKSTAGAEECEALAAAEGVIDIDGSSDDCSQSLSYKRYLLELGVSPIPHETDSKSERDSRESLQNFHSMQDESSFDSATQLSDDGNLLKNGRFAREGSEAGGQGDMGYSGTKELDTNPERGRGKIAEKSNIVSEEVISETSLVAATVFPTPEPKSSSSSEGEQKVFGNDGQSADRIAETENIMDRRSVSVGGTVKKKRKKKSKAKAVAESSLKFEDRGDYERVRDSSGGAERPAINSDREFSSMCGSFTASKEAGNLDSKVDFGTGEAHQLDARMQSSSLLSPIPKSADRHGQSFLALESTMNSSHTIDTSNVEKSPDTAVSVLGKVGAASISLTPVAADEPEELMVSRIETVVGEQPALVGSEVVETVMEQVVQAASKVVPFEIVERTAQVASKVVELPVALVEQAAQVEVQVVEILPDVVTEQVGQVVDQVSDIAEQVAQVVDHVSDVAEQVANTVNEQVTEQVSQVMEQVSEFADQVGQVVEQVSDVAEQVANTLNEQVEQVADNVSSTASQVAEQVTQGVDTVSSTASQVVDQVTEFFSSDEDDDSDSDDEFEAYITSDLPEFRGRLGLNNFIVRQEDQGVLYIIYDIYTYMLKQSFPKFAAAMFSAPIVVSAVFTLLYLPEFEGLAFDETARDFFAAGGGDSLTLQISWKTLFQVFMFSLSLSTGLQPELSPLSPYTLIVANLNALVAQLVFVFLSGAVFARLSQPSQPLRCSAVALVSTSPAQRKRKENGIKVFMARYVLSGPQPCELVDVKVDLTYKYNTHTRTGSFFRSTQSLKLVRPEIAFLTHGMLVRHVIDESSPLYRRTPEMLDKEDAVFCLSVVGLERASMQSVFHVQHYCVVDKDVIWDAEFEDIILINKKNRRVVDQSRLSNWRPFNS